MHIRPLFYLLLFLSCSSCIDKRLVYQMEAEGFDNLLVAGRGAGFSHIAASSCRLSRTMMSLGHAAGIAAWICASEDRAVWDVPIHRVQAEKDLKLRPKDDFSADPLQIQHIY